MKRLLIIISLLSIAACQSPKKDSSDSYKVTLEEIEQGFKSLKAQGIDFEKPLLYKYYFKNSQAEPLKDLAAELKKQDYKQTALFEEDTIVWLHMEKVELHTPASLFKRNEQLAELVGKFNVDAYDGFDIGNPVKKKGIPQELLTPPDSNK